VRTKCKANLAKKGVGPPTKGDATLIPLAGEAHVCIRLG